MSPVYSRVSRPPAPGAPLRPCIFLDRDGVIVEDTGYLHQVAKIRFIDGALAAITQLNQLAIPVVVITNQAGIGRGYYGWPEFEQVQAEIERRLLMAGGWIDGVWACACHPEGIGELCVPDHPFRKPNPGMIHAAAASLALDLSASWMVGDKPLDIEAAFRAGLRGAVHVLTGYGSETRPEIARWASGLPASPFELLYAKSLGGAVEEVTQLCHG